jgi:DnaJ family protein C protein 28
VTLEKLINQQIEDAMAAGAFDNLPGAGKPLPDNQMDKLAGDNWLGYKVLQNGGMVPAWLGLAREIEIAEQALERIDAVHAELVASAASGGGWERVAPGLRHAAARYEQHARALRKRQDSYNMDAPGFRSERPGIWVEFHLRRLRERALAAGCPAALIEASQ